MLDDPGVGARLVTLARVVAQPLERPRAGPDPLDRGDLLLEGEDRLDLQRRRRSRRGRRRSARRAAGTRGCRSRTTSSAPRGPARRGRPPPRRSPRSLAAAEAAERAEAHPAAGRPRVEEVDPLAALALVDQPLAGLARGLEGPRDARGDVDRGDFPAGVEQRLVDGDEVPDRGLRGRRAPSEARKLLEEAVVVGDLRPPAAGRRRSRRRG